MKHVFLILNFNTAKMTSDLVKKIVSHNKKVIIVDNGSKDNSLDLFDLNFKDNKLVTVVSSGENLGFAKGNNLGLKYIKDNNLDIDFLHCINSDIEINELDSMFNKLEKLDKDLFVIGPNVVHNCFRTSPMYIRNEITLKSDVEKDIKIYKRKIIKHKFGMKLSYFYTNYMDKKNSFIQTTDREFYSYQLKENEYYILNGAYIIYTKNYIDNYSVLFDSSTFLYYEEEILFYNMRKDNRKVAYVDDIKVIHNEGISSPNSVLLRYRRLLESILIFKNIINNDME